jgi:hypothetical protein
MIPRPFSVRFWGIEALAITERQVRRWSVLTMSLGAIGVAFAADPISISQGKESARDGKPSAHEANVSETVAAVDRAQAIRNHALALDAKRQSYSDEFINSLREFYFYGLGTPEAPSSPIVLHKFCQEFVISLVQDIFAAERPQDPNDPCDYKRSFENPLDPASRSRLCGFLAELLRTSKKNPSALQRLRVIYLVEAVAAARLGEDQSMLVSALESLLPESEPVSGDKIAILSTLDRIAMAAVEAGDDQ